MAFEVYKNISYVLSLTQNGSDVVLAPTTFIVFPEYETNILLDDDTFYVLQLIFFVILGILCGMFGTITNAINIVVFINQGLFSGGSTLNLFFLAVADFGVVFTNCLQGIAWAVIVADIPDLGVDPFAVMYLGVGWPHAAFTNINRILTAYVAFERCMCVVIPFRVQSLFAPKRSLVYLVTFFVYGFVSHIPIYLTHGLGYVWQEETNETKLVLVLGENREFWHDFVYYSNYFVLSFLTVIIVVVCTVITTAYVNTSKEWRQKTSASNTSSNNTKGSAVVKDETGKRQTLTKPSVDKEARLVKMITTISVIFCICYVPEVVLLIVRSVDERINTTGQYARLAHIMYAIKFFTATINSSINIFVYYRMSSKYRSVFLTCCRPIKSISKSNVESN